MAGLYCSSCIGKVVKCPRPDNKMVTVAQVSGGLGGGVLVTTNRPHCLKQKDIIFGENGLLLAEVQEVVAPTQIVVDVRGSCLEAGQRLEVERDQGPLTSLEQEVERLSEEEENVEMQRFLAKYSRENCQTKGLFGENMSPSDLLSLAGLLTSSLLSLLYHRPLPSGLRLTPSPSTPILSSSISLLISPSPIAPISSIVSSLLKEMGLVAQFVGPDLGEEERSTLFSKASAVISAGGSFDLRRGVEALCVEHSLPLLDLAVEGTAGQAELFLPHKTVSYSHVGEPQDSTPPHCVLKSFPHLPEHCAVWAKEKAASLAYERASATLKFCSEMKQSETGSLPKGASTAHKFLTLLGPNPTWFSCVRAARLKWQKYFSDKASQLVSTFPLTTLTSATLPFWSWPKLAPSPLKFDARPLSEHLEWVWLVAKALSATVGVQVTPHLRITGYDIMFLHQEGDLADLGDILSKVEVPEFNPRLKTVVTDETQERNDEADNEESKDELEGLDQLLMGSKVVASKGLPNEAMERLEVLSCHLRCDMYKVPREDDVMVLLPLGRIEPCLKATMARVVGLGVGELARMLNNSSESSSNRQPFSWWVGEGVEISAKTLPAPITKLPSGLSVSLWSKLEVSRLSFCSNFATNFFKVHATGPEFTLDQFLSKMSENYGVEVTMVVQVHIDCHIRREFLFMQDSRMIYVPFMPGHQQRRPKPMAKVVT